MKKQRQGTLAIVLICVYLFLKLTSIFSFDLARFYFSNNPLPLSLLPKMLARSLLANLPALISTLCAVRISLFFILDAAQYGKRDSRRFYYLGFGLLVGHSLLEITQNITLTLKTGTAVGWTMVSIATALVSHLLIGLYLLTGCKKAVLYRCGFLVAFCVYGLYLIQFSSTFTTKDPSGMEFLLAYRIISFICSIHSVLFAIARWLMIPKANEITKGEIQNA